jgi:hypothetical protein
MPRHSGAGAVMCAASRQRRRRREQVAGSPWSRIDSTPGPSSRGGGAPAGRGPSSTTSSGAGTCSTPGGQRVFIDSGTSRRQLFSGTSRCGTWISWRRSCNGTGRPDPPAFRQPAGRRAGPARWRQMPLGGRHLTVHRPRPAPRRTPRLSPPSAAGSSTSPEPPGSTPSTAKPEGQVARTNRRSATSRLPPVYRLPEPDRSAPARTAVAFPAGPASRPVIQSILPDLLGEPYHRSSPAMSPREVAEVVEPAVRVLGASRVAERGRRRAVRAGVVDRVVGGARRAHRFTAWNASGPTRRRF